METEESIHEKRWGTVHIRQNFGLWEAPLYVTKALVDANVMAQWRAFSTYRLVSSHFALKIFSKRWKNVVFYIYLDPKIQYLERDGPNIWKNWSITKPLSWTQQIACLPRINATPWSQTLEPIFLTLKVRTAQGFVHFICFEKYFCS